ncbi:5-formyltetrahydrofolate cyclo-ligase [Candidatus Curtissbacteria bacterium RBG_13_40_7]|uniref:5-formyltetrahydrofolate cyclo-ligase n=1 Tax=Candidatus Curtissbacteria bacterium RBG_13_40_7 TaxID=1797706 RepID=A0A1F5FZH0_9BACT|nr:MAG: 5-formyltetrahydrofolate cyclo-ligase [Candidatus Curtissbacteria bacterium RBG_13_40_7]
MAATDNLKRGLRQLYLQKRRALTLNTVLQKSQSIAIKVLNLTQIINNNVISCYIPINNEVDTKDLIDNLLEQGKTVVLPCLFQKDHKYHFGKFINRQELKEGPFGILQPKNPIAVNPSKIEVAILPGLAFAKTGVRLGYGKGVFDKLLSWSKALKIGLAYDFQIIDEIPKEKQDILVDLIVTERLVWRVGGN